MKKIIIIIIILVSAVVLFPIRLQMKDGGTVHYDAICYDVYKVRRITYDTECHTETITGTVIKIFGVEVYNSTSPHINI